MDRSYKTTVKLSRKIDLMVVYMEDTTFNTHMLY